MQLNQGVHVLGDKLVNVTEFIQKATILRPGELNMLMLDRHGVNDGWFLYPVHGCIFKIQR